MELLSLLKNPGGRHLLSREDAEKAPRLPEALKKSRDKKTGVTGILSKQVKPVVHEGPLPQLDQTSYMLRYGLTVRIDRQLVSAGSARFMEEQGRFRIGRKLTATYETSLLS
jgi:hypothetical protein